MVKMNPASESFEHDGDVEVDQLLQNVPDSILDNRSYYWPNFVHPRFIHHERYKFVYTFQLPTIRQSSSYYVASFVESLLLTWIGLEANISRRIGDSSSIQVNVVNGPNPFDCEHKNTCYVPHPVRRQEHISVHRRMTEDRINFGQRVHVRVHRNYSLELSSLISHHTTLRDVTVVVKVQTPNIVGGVEDHVMWDQAEYERIQKYKQDNLLYYKNMLRK